MFSLFMPFFIYFLLVNIKAEDIKYCEKLVENEEKVKSCKVQESHFSNKRYILYDVNPLEGFNLRRDVYIRIATFVRKLADESRRYEWHLILPPWGNLLHWHSSDVGVQNQIPWKLFFDIESLKKYAPVLEMYEFMQEYSVEGEETVLDCVYIIKNDEEMFKTGDFREMNIVTNCSENGIPYKQRNDERFSGYFWGYDNISARNVKCLTFHGTVLNLKTNLQPLLYKTVMFDHMEIPLHDFYGSVEYWRARRSMRYNLELYAIANEFRASYLNSNDLDDKILRPKDWRFEKENREVIGGPYLAVHFRRRDFTIGRASSTPTIKSAVLQIKEALNLLNLKIVFVATDAEEKEFVELSNELEKLNYIVHRFIPTKSVKQKFKDGGIAIIDQIICSHARYFIGTHESTFTFRIQEDREILGFSANSTFNRLCVTDVECPSVGRWQIVWK